MSLSTQALVTLNQAKSFLKIDSGTSLMILAEYVGTGTGTEDDFTLDHTPLEGTLTVYVNSAVKTETTHYTLTGAVVTFTAGNLPTNGQIVTASYTYAASSDAFESYDEDIIERLIEAATKKCEDWCERKFVNVTLTEKHVGDGLKILRLYRRPIVSITSVHYEKTERFTGDGVTLIFTLAETPVTASVYVNGTLKTVTTDYAISAKTLTFTVTGLPADDAKIIVKYTVVLDLIDDYTELLDIGRLKGSWLKDYIYQVIYVAGYGADRTTVQPLLPDAVTAVLVAVANWYENRTGVSSESISGIGSVTYDQGLPEASKKLLGALKV